MNFIQPYINTSKKDGHWLHKCIWNLIFKIGSLLLGINSLWLSDAMIWHGYLTNIGSVMAWCLTGTKPLPEPMLTYCQTIGKIFQWFQIQKFSFKKMHLKMVSAKWQPFCSDLKCAHIVAHTGVIYTKLTEPIGQPPVILITHAWYAP